MFNEAVIFLAILSSALPLSSCDSPTCDPIFCRTSVAVKFATPESNNYALSLRTGSVVATADCPGTSEGTDWSLTCNDVGFSLASAAIVDDRLSVSIVRPGAGPTTDELRSTVVGQVGGDTCPSACIMRTATLENL